MGLMQFFKDMQGGTGPAARYQRQERELRRLRRSNIQLSTDILALKRDEQDVTQHAYKGNEYREYAGTVQALNDKYCGSAEWGVFQTGNIVDLRAAFIIMEGPQVIPTEPGGGEAEREFSEKFLDYNDLDAEAAQEFAKEAEIEGKALIKLSWEDKAKMVSARFVSWQTKKYTIETDPLDYMDYTKASWPAGATWKAETLKPEEFIYKKFGGRISQPNEARSKVMKVLTLIDRLDMALRDWRAINRLFAAPIPSLKCDTRKEVEQANADIEKLNWKVGKFLAHTGVLSYIQPDIKGIEGLEKEIIALAKMISGATGIPVHFLGLPDLLSNRATAENLMELIYASTLKEREMWTGAYAEMLRKAMDIFNTQTGLEQRTTKLDPNAISVEIPFVSREHWEHLEKVLVPLALGGLISKELILSKIPGINLDEELKRDKEQSKLDLESLKKENADLKAEKDLAGLEQPTEIA